MIIGQMLELSDFGVVYGCSYWIFRSMDFGYGCCDIGPRILHHIS